MMEILLPFSNWILTAFVVPLIYTTLVRPLMAYLGVRTEQKHAEAIKAAIANSVTFILRANSQRIGNTEFLREPVIKYLLQNVPDAYGHFTKQNPSWDLTPMIEAEAFRQLQVTTQDILRAEVVAEEPT